MGRSASALIICHLQRHVLALYRHVLRKARAVEDTSLAADIRQRAREQLERCVPLLRSRCQPPHTQGCRHRDVDKLDLTLIEHLMRRGKRQLDLVTSGSVSGIQQT